MINDVTCVQACAATYTFAPTLPVPSSDVNCRITFIEDDGAALVVAFRGSITPIDWATDFYAVPVEDREHPQLGICHAGFLSSAESIFVAVTKQLALSSAAVPVLVTGHSYGGALALGVGALLALAGRKPAAIVTFGAPRFGMATFVKSIADIPVRQYRRGNDPVPWLPFDVLPLLDWRDARDPLIVVGQAQRNPFASHHIGGYVDDVTAYLQKKQAA